MLLDKGYSSETVDGYSLLKVEDFLELFNERKPTTHYTGGPDGGFDYSAHDLWYDTESCLSQFFFASPISEDNVDVYAGYTIKITVTPFITDADGAVIDADISVSPSVVMQGNPGEEVDLTELLGGLTWTAGYEPCESGAWYSTKGTESPITTYEGGHVVIHPRADYEIFLRLQVAEYTVTVQVQQNEGDTVTIDSFTMEVKTDGGFVVSENRSATYGQGVRLAVPSSGYTDLHVDYVSGSTVNGQVPSDEFEHGTGGDSFTVGFQMPNGDLTLVLHLTDLYNVNVNLPLTGSSDNSRFSVTLTETDGTITIGLTAGSGDRSASVKVSEGKLVFSDGLGTGVGGRDYAVVVTDGNGNKIESGYTTGVLTADVSFNVYVSVKWSLSYDHEGYSVQRYPVDPVTGQVSETADGVTPGTVLTGDRLVLVPNPGHSVDAVTATGAVRDPVKEHTFIVSGTLDVVLSQASSEWTLTVHVEFYANGVRQEVPEGQCSVILTGPSGETVLTTPSSTSPDRLTYTDALAAGTYTVEASFYGYTQDVVVEVELLADAKVTVRMNLVDTSFTLTVTVGFGDGADLDVLAGSTFSVDDGAGVEGTVSGTGIVYMFTVEYGSHRLDGGFPGYSLDPEMPYGFTVTGDTELNFRATAVEYTIVYDDGTVGGVVATWTVADHRSVIQIYRDNKGTGSPAGWVDSTGGRVVQNSADLEAGMFTDGMLTLEMVSAIIDIAPAEPGVMDILVLRTQLDGLTVGIGFDVSGYQIVSGEYKVTVTCEDGTITLTATGGTGSFTVLLEGEGEALILRVTVLEPIDAIYA